MRTLRFVTLPLLAIILASVQALPAGAQDTLQKERYADVRDALSSSGNLSGSGGPQNINWIDGGERYSYMQFNADTRSMEIRAYSPESGEDELIFNNGEYTFPGSDSTFQYNSFQWSNDSRYLVFQSNFRPVYRRSGISDYYLYSVEEGSLELLAEDARTAELSPDGRKIGYEREGDLYVYDIAGGEERRLTDSAEENFYNGRFGWVYEEEFGLAQAWSWSPDSEHIAYWQTDERHVNLFRMTDYSGQHAEYVQIPYPKVGDVNPTVRIGVVSVESGERRWMDKESGEGYIPRIYWTSREDELAIVHLNRPQTRLRLTFHDIATGEGGLVMEEQSDTWIDVFDFFAGINHLFFFPEGQQQFYWISDRDGWSHIYRYNYDGTLAGQVTGGEWEVTYVHTVNEEQERIYYTSTEASPLERQLYSVNLDGSGKIRHTDAPGTHNITMGGSGEYYIDRWSNTDTPTQVELRSTESGRLRLLEDNSEVSEYIESNVYAPRELFRFTTTDGQELDGYMIRPVDFDSTESYPLVMAIYGGPGAQGVYNSFESNGWFQYLAQEGYVVVNVNNRGSGGYGSAFEKIVYKQLGRWEANDFVETARHMAGKPWIDGERMAIRGHSYGGYMSSYVMLVHPGVFRAGVVGAPVTDWRLYDSIYTERYMGLLENNREGYEQSAPTSYASGLEGELLIAHSTYDENVHVQNTMQLLTALASNGKSFDLQIYPPGAHGVSFNSASHFLLYETYTEFLEENLRNVD